YEAVRSYKPQIIHGAVFEGNTMAFTGGLLGGVPIVLLEETSDPKNRSGKAHLLLKLMTTVADRMVAVSPATARYLEKTAKINPKKIQLINNGVEIPRPAKKAELDRLRRSHGIREDDLVVGSVGRVWDRVKLFSDIIKAIALLPGRAKIKILIVGDGPDTEQLHNLAMEKGLAEHLIMPGVQMDTAPYYGLMDIFCIASDNEGFGLVAVEAMFHQLPVVATSVGGLKDIVIDGETGFLVPSHSPQKIAERLQLLINDSTIRKTMGEAGRIRAEKEYSAAVYAEKVHRLYQELIKEKYIH
ncbi:MAG TPA: glycosyltransferase family 4 protein, partial [Cyclobacteriaceae bacterium]|nr:glycosyltransferase family 4 protein [Cyclobacteriaceae bacterium]